MMEDVGYFSSLIYWFTPNTILFILWTILTVFYAKNRWFDYWSNSDQHVDSFSESFNTKQHEARQRSIKTQKKYEWDSYDSTFNDHWRQRLMSYSAVPVVNSQASKISPRSATQQSSPNKSVRSTNSSELQKARNNSPLSMNKLVVPQNNKCVMDVNVCERLIPIKQFQPTYGLGIYPKVNLVTPKPILLTDNRSHMKKNTVTIKLTPTLRPTSPENEVDDSLENSVITNLKKSARKRQLKMKSTMNSNDLKKKQRVENPGGESHLQGSIVPDHFIEDATTATLALKQLEKVNNVLIRPKNNAIDTSFSSMKRMRANCFKRDRSSVDEDEVPKMKILRQEGLIEENRNIEKPQEICLETPKATFASAFQTNKEIDMEHAIMQVDEDLLVSKEKEADDVIQTRHLFIPTLQDHLHDREFENQRLQKILKRIVQNKDEALSPTKTQAASPVTFGMTTTKTDDVKSDDKTQLLEVPALTENKSTTEITIVSEPNSPISQSTSPIVTSWSPTTLSTDIKTTAAATDKLSPSPLKFMTTDIKSSPVDSSKLTAFSPTFSATNGVEPTGEIKLSGTNARTTTLNTPTFQFGSKSPTNGSDVYTFGTSNANNVSNGFQFTAALQPNFNFAAADTNFNGPSMFSMGSGSTAPRRSKLSASRNRVR